MTTSLEDRLPCSESEVNGVKSLNETNAQSDIPPTTTPNDWSSSSSSTVDQRRDEDDNTTSDNDHSLSSHLLRSPHRTHQVKRERGDSPSPSPDSMPASPKLRKTDSEVKQSDHLDRDSGSDEVKREQDGGATTRPRIGRGFDQPSVSDTTVDVKTEEYANQAVKEEMTKKEAAEAVAKEEQRVNDEIEKKEKKRKSKWDLETPSDDLLGVSTSGGLLGQSGLPLSGFSDAPTLPVGGGMEAGGGEGCALASALSSAIASAQQKHGLVGTEARRASRLSVANLPPGVTEGEIVMFFNAALVSIAGNQLSTTDASKLPVICSEMFNPANKSCVLQFRTQQDAQATLALNGIAYNASPLAITSIPDYADVEGAEEDHRIFLQNLALDMTEKQVRSLLEQFGEIKSCVMAKDAAGYSKGLGVVEFEDPTVTDVAIQALNGFTVGTRALMVRRASTVGTNLLAPGSVPVQRSSFVSHLPTSMSHRVFSNHIVAQQVRKARSVGDQPSPVVQLLNCVFREDLTDDKNYNEIVEDIKQEASKFGHLQSVIIPRPAADLSHVPGVGKVFLHYSDVTAARKAQWEMNGRKFDRRSVCAAFYPEDRFRAGVYTFLSSRG